MYDNIFLEMHSYKWYSNERIALIMGGESMLESDIFVNLRASNKSWNAIALLTKATFIC